MQIELFLEVFRVVAGDGQFLCRKILILRRTAHLKLIVTKFKEIVGIFAIRDQPFETEAQLLHIEIIDFLGIAAEDRRPGQMQLRQEGMDRRFDCAPAVAPVLFQFLYEVGLRKIVGKQDVEPETDDPAQRIGEEVVDIIEAESADELNVFDQQRHQETGDDRPEMHVLSKDIEHVGQKIAHRDKEDDIHVDLHDVIDLFDSDMAGRCRKSFRENRSQEAEKSQIDLYGVAEILIERNVQKIVVSRRARKQNDIKKQDDIDKEEHDQDKLAQMQVTVGLRIHRITVVSGDRQFSADPAVNKRHEKHHDEHHESDRNAHS